MFKAFKLLRWAFEVRILAFKVQTLSAIPLQRRTKSPRKRNTPENAGNRPFPESAFSGVLRFRVLFVPL